jgi:hypothetical protein
MSEDIREMSADTLKSKTDALVSNKEIKDNCTRVSREMRGYSKLDEFVLNMEKLAETGREEI